MRPSSLLALVALVASCHRAPEGDASCTEDAPARTLRSRIGSPDGARSAIVLATNGGATTHAGAVVCVESAGKRRVVASSGQGGAVTVSWQSSHRLEVKDLMAGEAPHVFDLNAPWTPVNLIRNGTERSGAGRAVPLSITVRSTEHAGATATTPIPPSSARND